MIFKDLHYLWPMGANLLYLTVLWVILWWLLYRYRQKLASTYDLLQTTRSRLFFVLQGFLLSLAWIAACLAIIQPLANGHYLEGAGKPALLEVQRPSHEVILMIDSSASMQVNDMHNKQTRLKYAQQLADELVEELDGQQISLYTFTSDLFALSPPTLDYLFIRLMLNQIEINPENTVGTDYFNVLVDLYKRLNTTSLTTLKTIVLFTDGGDTSIEMSSVKERVELTKALMDRISSMLQSNVRLYAVGMGSEAGGKIPDVKYEGHDVISSLNAALLKEMSTKGHGKYIEANHLSVIEAASILADDFNTLSTGAQGQDINQSVGIGAENLIYDHYFYVPLFVAILALLFAMYLPHSWTISSIFSLLVLIHPLQADEIRQIVVYAEAGLYSEALNHIDILLQTKLENWQKNTALYDKGTIFLQQTEEDLALELYTSISPAHLPPLLQSSLQTNLGITYLEKARLLQDQNEPPFSLILALQDKAKVAFKRSKKGVMPNIDADRLLQIVAVERVQAVEALASAMLTTSSLPEGLSLLQLNLKELLADLDFVQGTDVDEQIKQQYVAQFLIDQGKWMLLWETQKRQWEAVAAEDMRKKGEESFFDGYKQYREGLDDLRLSRWEKAIENFQYASQSVNSALKAFFAENPIQDVLQQILTAYKRVLGKEMLSQSLLNALQEEQMILSQNFDNEGIKESIQDLKHAQKQLPKSQLVSRFYVEMGKEKIRTALSSLQSVTPFFVLEELIQKQLYVELLTHLALKMNKEELAAYALITKAQQQVAEDALNFLTISLKYQTQLYQTPSKKRCQARPWDVVFPLFDKGFKEARQALKLLKESALAKAASQEASAIIQWQQALTALKKPVTDDSSPCQAGGGGEAKDDDSLPADEKSQTLSTKPKQQINDILRVLQELNIDDLLPKTDQGNKKQGLRPW